MYRHKKIPIGRSRVAVYAFCPNEAGTYGIESWSLRLLQAQVRTEEDSIRKQKLALGFCDALLKVGVYVAYALSDVSSAGIVDSRVLEERVHLGGGVFLRQNLSTPPDGVFIRKEKGEGRAVVMSGNGIDCSIIVAVAGDLMIIARGGIDSLIDPGVVVGAPTRGDISIVDTIVRAFCERGVFYGIEMCMLFPNHSSEHRFDHWLNGKRNRGFATFVDEKWPGCAIRGNGGVSINLEKVFLAQCADKKAVHDAWTEFPLARHPAMAYDDRHSFIVAKRVA